MPQNQTPPGRSPTRRSRAPATQGDFSHITGSARLSLAHHRRWPLCRVLLYCADCSWARDYNPYAVAVRLQALQAGGDQARVSEVARRVGWPCPACGHMKWAATLAYPKQIDPRAIERRRRQLRS